MQFGAEDSTGYRNCLSRPDNVSWYRTEGEHVDLTATNLRAAKLDVGCETSAGPGDFDNPGEPGNVMSSALEVGHTNLGGLAPKPALFRSDKLKYTGRPGTKVIK